MGKMRAIVAAGAGFAALAAWAPEAGAETLKGYTYMPVVTHPVFQGLEQMAEEFAKATGDETTIRMNTGGSLPISSTDITAAVGDGVIDIASDGFFLGNIRVGGVLRLPLLIVTRDEYDTAADIMRPYLEAALDKQGVVLLGQYLYPLQVAFSAEELRSLDDLKGQKMRVTSPEQGEFVQRFGGVPVTIGAPEVPTSLQRGVVNGVFTASAGGGRTWKDMLKYNYRLGPNYFNSLVVINKDVWEGLGAEKQAALQAAATRACATITDALFSQEAELTEQFAKEGMVITEPEAADITAASAKMADFWASWAEGVGPDAVEALAKVREALGR